MSKITSLINEHEKLRTTGINLIASENVLSAKVKHALSSDLAGRYFSDWYGGTKYVREIISETEDLARKLFNVKYAIVTSLSGNMCDMAVMFAYTKPDDKVAMMNLDVGGYPFGVSKFSRKLLPLPADSHSYELKVDETIKVISEEKAPLTILGASYIPFPHPVKEISKGIKDISTCVYDGSHVLGLLACKGFQDPLREGAEVLIGSTHKSLYGPQGGLILTDSKLHYEKLNRFMDFDIDEGLGLVDNPHVNRIAALGCALEDLSEDPHYGERIVKNAQALAKALDDQKVPVKFKERNYTESHQIFMDIPANEAESLCRSLEKVGVFIDIAARIGLAEPTHRGLGTSDMDFIAEVIAKVYQGDISDKLRDEVHEFGKRFMQ
jgi:glycine hydroxymethyltransferase